MRRALETQFWLGTVGGAFVTLGLTAMQDGHAAKGISAFAIALAAATYAGIKLHEATRK